MCVDQFMDPWPPGGGTRLLIGMKDGFDSLRVYQMRSSFSGRKLDCRFGNRGSIPLERAIMVPPTIGVWIPNPERVG